MAMFNSVNPEWYLVPDEFWEAIARCAFVKAGIDITAQVNGEDEGEREDEVRAVRTFVVDVLLPEVKHLARA